MQVLSFLVSCPLLAAAAAAPLPRPPPPPPPPPAPPPRLLLPLLLRRRLLLLLLLLVRLLFLQKHGLLSACVVYAGLKLRAPETPEALSVALVSQSSLAYIVFRV